MRHKSKTRGDIKRTAVLIVAFSSVLIFSYSFAQQDFEDFTKQRQQDLDRLDREYAEFEAQQAADFEKYVKEVTAKWNEFKNSSRRDWYDYSNDLNTLSKVDFEEGEVTIVTIVPADAKDIEEQAQRNIAGKVKKLFSVDTVSGERVLDNQVSLVSGESVTSANADKFVEEKVLPNIVTEKETIKSEDGVERVKVKTTFALIPDHLRVRAEKYLPFVRKLCKRFELEVPLVFAVIQTESYFNPRAKSSAPAYGLMQLVPRSGGRDAYNFVFKKDKIVSPRYLYNPDNNLELGCGYLAKLRDNEFKNIRDSDAQRYCIIASYNTGPANCSKAITGKKNVKGAVKKINGMDKDRVYRQLKNNLPYSETRDYLEKVESRRENYLEWQ